ncbi:hypothetical protein R1sor_011935 [Riccia sorocarpa]|uniref:Uncharacterized protein n=1 Tax=Riccia sorocarpa TaxID=122646 RepID=A0ABD3I5R6_9MARC
MMEKPRYYSDVFRGRRKSSTQKVGTISPVVEQNGDIVTIKIPSNLITSSSRTSLSLEPKERSVSSPNLDETEEEENTKELQAEEIYPRIPRRLSFNHEESGVRDNPGMKVFNLKVYYSEIVIDGALKTYPETKVSTIVSPLLANRSHFVTSIRRKLQSFGVNPHSRLTLTPIPSLPDDREYSVAHWMKRFPGAAFVVSPKHELDALYRQLVTLKGGGPATRNPFYALEPQVTPIDYRAEEHIPFASPSGEVETAQTDSSQVRRGSRTSVTMESMPSPPSWAITGQEVTDHQNMGYSVKNRGEGSLATPGSWSDPNSRTRSDVMMVPATLSSSSQVVTGQEEKNQDNVRYQKQRARESLVTTESWLETDSTARSQSASSRVVTGEEEIDQENVRLHSSQKRGGRGSLVTLGSSSYASSRIVTDDTMVSATLGSESRAGTGQAGSSQEGRKSSLTMCPQGRDGPAAHGRPASANAEPNPRISLTVPEIIESHRRELEMLQEKLFHTTSQLMRVKKDHATDIHDVVESHRGELRVIEEKLSKATSQLMDMEKDHLIKDTTIRSLERKLEEYNGRINEIEQSLRFITVESYQARLRDVYRRMFLQCVRKKLRAKLRAWFTSPPSPVDYHLVSYDKVIETCEQMEDLEKHLGVSREAVRLTLEDASTIWEGVHDSERIHIGIYAEVVHTQPRELAVAYRSLFFFLYNQEPETVLDNLIKSWTRKPLYFPCTENVVHLFRRCKAVTAEQTGQISGAM